MSEAEHSAESVEVVEPRVLSVPGDYATLQAAIDAAQDGDRIVYSRQYRGNIDFRGKRIALTINEPAVDSTEGPAPDTGFLLRP